MVTLTQAQSSEVQGWKPPSRLQRRWLREEAVVPHAYCYRLMTKTEVNAAVPPVKYINWRFGRQRRLTIPETVQT